MSKLNQQLEDAKGALTVALEGTDADAIKNATEAVKAAQDAVTAAKEGAGWQNEMISKEETPNDRCQ